MKIILETLESIDYDMKTNILNMISKIQSAAHQQADLICFGESFLQGVQVLSWDPIQDAHLAIKIYSVEMKILMECAKYYQIAIAFGFYEECYRSFYSSYVFIDDQGMILDMYRCCNADWQDNQADTSRYRSGTSFHTFTYKGKRFISTLGNDLNDSQFVEKINEFEKDIILCPTVGCIDEEAWAQKQAQFIAQYIRVNQDLLIIPTLSLQSCVGTSIYLHEGKVEKEKVIEI